ncbi:MAG: dipeptide epimerase [Elusimicrobia bacterium]|nr:dipeptide epimerase [Elusimicrobiota bacterium]
MSSTIISSFVVETFTTPLKRPFVTSLGRKEESCNVAFSVTLKDGSAGYGEASSSLALAHLRPAGLAAALRRLGRSCLGKDAAGAAAMVDVAWAREGGSPPAVSAFEAALLEALLASRGLTLADWLGGALRSIETDITLSASDPASTAAATREAAADGFRKLKVKVGGDLAENLSRVRAALSGLPGRKGSLILDGNQGMTLRGALRLVEACRREGAVVELLEQPLPKHDYAGMRRLTAASPVPVAADEMAMTPEDAVRLADAGAASAINIKLAKSGVLRGLKIAAVARAAGLGLMVGCMAETGRGLTASVHFALGTGFFRWADLDSDYLHRDARPPTNWRRNGPILSLGARDRGVNSRA